VGTFYDFIQRLYPQDDGYFIKREDLQGFKPKPNKRAKQGEKMPPRHPGIVEKLVNRVIAGKGIPLANHSQEDPQSHPQGLLCGGLFSQGHLGQLPGSFYLRG
jgi:hypothetical protein